MWRAQVAEPVIKAVEPALGTLAQTILGSICLVAIAVAVVAVWQLIRVQNARAADQKKLRDDYKDLMDRNEKLVDKMATAFIDMKSALASLTEAEKTGQSALMSMKTTIDNVNSRMDLLILARRPLSPYRGYPAVDPDDEPGGGGRRKGG